MYRIDRKRNFQGITTLMVASITSMYVIVLYLIWHMREALSHNVVSPYGMMGIVTLLYLLIILLLIYYFLIPILQFRSSISEMLKKLRVGELKSFPEESSDKSNKELDQLLEIIEKSVSKGYLSSMLMKQAQLDNLQSQINPHFLYNILDSVRGDVIEQGLDETADLIESLSKFFRYGIGSSAILIPFEDEYKYVLNYMKIQQYRFGNRINMIKEFDENDGHIMNFLLPKMTLQPIVENAINHGIEGRVTKGKIIIRVTYTDRRMMITIEDNGVGMTSDKVIKINQRLNDPTIQIVDIESKGTGVALLNVSERIKLTFGEDYGIHVNSTLGHGTEVHISLPFTQGV